LTATNTADSKGRDRTALYRFLQVIVGFTLRIYFRHSTHGLNHIPDSTGAVVATNHASVLDPPLIGVEIPRPLFIMAKQSLHDIPLFGSFIRAMHSFPVKRGAGDQGAIRKAIEIVNEGNLVLIFLEGTRTRDGTLGSPKPGIGKIVDETGCPVVPGYVDGSFDALGPGQWFPRPVNTSTRFGESLEFSDANDASSGDPDGRGREYYKSIADDVMKSIKKLKEHSET
jgi:1-acyl-sn-glycerol-3-phosphate acyltransferase